MPRRESKTSSPKLKPLKALSFNYNFPFITRGITFNIPMNLELPSSPLDFYDLSNYI